MIYDVCSIKDDINDLIFKSQKEVINKMVDDFDLDSKIGEEVKSIFVSRLMQGMNLKKLEIHHDHHKCEDILSFEVILKRDS